MNYPKSLEDLIESFKKLPSIGAKTAERLALSVLSMDKEQVSCFAESLVNVKNKIGRCTKCNNLSEMKLCSICLDTNRNSKLLCVVEDVKNVVVFEKLSIFKGLYFVLNGLISPLDNINPEDIGILKLLERIEEEGFEEIILAIKPSLEGEITSMYITKKINTEKLKVSKIARGVPIGIEMEYMDALTLEHAFEDRTNA